MAYARSKAQLFAPTTIAATLLTLAHLLPNGLSGALDGLFAKHAAKPAATVASTESPQVAGANDFEARLQPAYFQIDAMPRRAGAPRLSRVTVEIEDGDNLTALLLRNEVAGDDARALIESLKPSYDVRKVRVGQAVTLLFDRSQPQPFRGVEFEPDAERTVMVARKDGTQFVSQSVKRVLSTRTVAARGTIRSSLFEAGANASVPHPVMIAMIKAFSYDVDFQRDLQPGDKFEVTYEVAQAESGETIRTGDVMYASLTLSGKQRQIYGYRRDDGSIDYFDRTGKSVRKALLRTPIDGAKLTSGYGMRNHPMLGFTRMHKGVDFGAAVGTPVYAAGDGSIEQMGWWGGYGRYIRVKHNGQMSTAYAHLSRFGNNLAAGNHIRQGQVIGYVGTTGNSTGPHLHYEVLKNGEQTNPNNMMLPAGNNLEPKEMVAFAKLMQDREIQAASLGSGVQYASARAPAIVPVSCRIDSPC